MEPDRDADAPDQPGQADYEHEGYTDWRDAIEASDRRRAAWDAAEGEKNAERHCDEAKADAEASEDSRFWAKDDAGLARPLNRWLIALGLLAGIALLAWGVYLVASSSGVKP